MALKLLTGIIPSGAGNSIFGNAARPTCDGELLLLVPA